MEKFGQFICKHKVAILIISLLLLIPSIIGYKATRVNYDILVYLPDNIETIKGENILADDFDMGAFSVVILENMQSKDIIELEIAKLERMNSTKFNHTHHCMNDNNIVIDEHNINYKNSIKSDDDNCNHQTRPSISYDDIYDLLWL